MLQKFCCLWLKPGSLVVGSIHAVLFGWSSLISLLWLFRINGSSNHEVYVTSIIFAAAVVHTLASGMLILGINKNKHLFMLPWLVDVSLTVVMLSLATLILLYNIIYFVNCEGILVLLGLIAFLAILIYMFLAVYAYYKVVQGLDDRTEVQLLQTPNQQMPPRNSDYPNFNRV